MITEQIFFHVTLKHLLVRKVHDMYMYMKPINIAPKPMEKYICVFT